MKDDLGLELSGADAGAHDHYRVALRGLQTFTGDPLAALERAIAARPDFTMAHVLKGWLHALSTEAAAMQVARGAHEAALALPMTDREAAHVAALGALAGGGWAKASRILEVLAKDEPRDALALQIGHQIDFFTGNAPMLRDRIARALLAWDDTMPGYHAMLAAHAFGLEECGEYSRAEAEGRKAARLEPLDGWAQHAVAHVLEMQSRQREGILWMRSNEANWAGDSFLKVHNWWHLALYHYELGDHDAVLSLYDEHVFGEAAGVVLNLVDASALLWRLHLAGVDCGDRWEVLAERWAPHAGAANHAFNDAHAMMAFAAAGRADLMAELEDAQARAAAGAGDNAAFTRDVGQPVAQAVKTFAQGHPADAVRLLLPVRDIAHRFGGSHAQRDFLDLTLIEAVIRTGEATLARSLSAKRHEARPTSPLSELFRKRAADIG
ncbi:MAG: tetratricopeptide repeat protein [Rhizobiaceae bacterium]|nr:tetratricopeptide repeat protein [Rhizobiaceae bacterium]MCV0408313.1 tetratricopeptide repeat protein [Rhizobiaceae bacterium]